MLFGNIVSSDIFSDLVQPDFSPERASVRISAQQEILRIFLENFLGIQVDIYLHECWYCSYGSTIESLRVKN